MAANFNAYASLCVLITSKNELFKLSNSSDNTLIYYASQIAVSATAINYC